MKYGIGLLASAVPTARTRSANPAGAFTSPSRFRSIITVAMVLSSQDFQAAMDVGLHRPHGLPQSLRDLRVGQLLDVPEHDRLAVAGGQAGDPRRQLVDLGPTKDVLLRT